MAEWYEILIPIALLSTAVVALFSIYYLKKQSKMTEDAFISSKKVSEVNALLKIEQNLLFNESMKKVRLEISKKGPVLMKDGGIIEFEDFATYLDSINRLVYFSHMKVIKEEIIVGAFGATAIEIENNPFVMKHIKHVQTTQGKKILQEIHNLAELRRRNSPGP